MSEPLPAEMPGHDSQAEVIAHLSDPASHGACVDQVERIDTHGAMVFLAGEWAYKIKRAVKFAYMDFSTLEKRHRMCLRELEINSRTAPKIYNGVVAITREPDGRLRIDGIGTPVEWAILMCRFDQYALLARIADRGGVDDELIRKLAEVVSHFHAHAEPVYTADGQARMAAIVNELASAFAGAPDLVAHQAAEAFAQQAMIHLRDVGECLSMRTHHGDVRRCHGDLHLNNIVMISGQPVLFDAIEFSDDIATIDILYDLAFLIMDLDQRGHRPQANLLLNRYLYHSGSEWDLSGLAALPLFLSCRAGIRAMVTMQRAHQLDRTTAAPLLADAKRYFEHARAYLQPEDPQLVAIGGFSGSGKSTLAAALAPLMGTAPGAIHLRSDLERKAMFAVAETHRLTAEHYTPDASRQVYQRLLDKAKILLESGRTVIVDAVHSTGDERKAVHQVAQNLGLTFRGVWLTTEPGELRHRVDARIGDASDATSQVVDMQIARGTGPMTWSVINAGGNVEQTLAAARRELALD